MIAFQLFHFQHSPSTLYKMRRQHERAVRDLERPQGCPHSPSPVKVRPRHVCKTHMKDERSPSFSDQGYRSPTGHCLLAIMHCFLPDRPISIASFTLAENKPPSRKQVCSNFGKLVRIANFPILSRLDRNPQD